MTEQLLITLIVAVAGPTVVLLVSKRLTRAKDTVDVDASLSAQWRLWADELKNRVDRLEQKVADLETALASEEATNLKLRTQVAYQSKLLRSVVRWALTLKDELVRSGGTVPLMPADVETALTSLDTE